MRCGIIGWPPAGIVAWSGGDPGFDAHAREIRRNLSGRLDPERTEELVAALRDAGIPT